MATYWSKPGNLDFVEGRRRTAEYTTPLDLGRWPFGPWLGVMAMGAFLVMCYSLQSPFWLLPGMVGPIFALSGLTTLVYLRNSAGLARVTRATAGEVLEVKPGDDGDNPVIGIAYAYQVAGKTYRGHTNHYELNQGVPEPGDRVWVLCLPSDPGTHALL